MSGRRLLGRLLALALVGAALLFLGLTIARNAGELRRFAWHPDVPLLLLSVLVHTLVLVWGVFVWHRVVLHTTTERVPFRPLLRIWFLSAVARYIPGKIWQFVAAAQLAGRAGLSGAAVLTSMAIHIGFTLLAAAIVSVATLVLPDAWPLGRGLTVAGVVVAALALAHPLVLRTALRLIPRALHRDVVAWRGSWLDGAGLLALSVASWLLYGAAFHLFVSSMVELPAGSLLPFAGINALSFLAGYAVLVAPAGIGVREGAMTALLAPFLPAAVAAVVALLSRLWTIAAELLGAAVLLAGRRGLGDGGAAPGGDVAAS